MKECIFCQIVSGEIPNYTVYENNQILAFLDINPKAKGHTVVIPKIHAENLLDLNEQFFHDFLVGVKEVQERIDHTLNPDGYNVGWNHGEAGGQVVPHLHVHILPRWQGDGGSNIHGIVNQPGDVPVAEVAKLFER